MLKKLMFAAFGAAVLVLLAGGVTQLQAQVNWLTSYQCDPLSCEEGVGPVYSGGVSVDIIGECLKGQKPPAEADVEAVGCSEAFYLVATATEGNAQVQGYAELGWVGAGATATAYYPEEEYWQMEQIRFCNMTLEEDVDSPEPC
jgi:hypothetical protein